MTTQPRSTLAEQPESDGRRLRRVEGRESVLETVELAVRRGAGPTTVEAVAEMADVSVSTLYRYFDGVDDLREQVAERILADVMPLVLRAPTPSGVEARAQEFVRVRLQIVERLEPVLRFAERLGADDQATLRTTRRFQRRFREQTERFFESELSGLTGSRRRDAVLAIELLVSPWSHRMLVARAELSNRQITRLWQRSVVSLLPR